MGDRYYCKLGFLSDRLNIYLLKAIAITMSCDF